ncbi:MAG: hypothetical protein A2Z05_05555 [Chloroflexi bacterium RBG_16_60_22]|nr:MAG: hypothetical protein A2Z05_05555 [Chloroflexi bacterium RBG_16_60_22]
MSTKKPDYSIFDKFNFERKPVGVNFSLNRPEGIRLLDKELALCELFKEAQTGRPFYVDRAKVQCGEQVVGMLEFPPVMYSGQLGPSYSMFKTAGANRRIYDYVPVLPKDSVKFITHAAYDQMTFDPDVLIITASPSQAEIILRASSYSDGKMWHAKGTTCLACAWIYAHPYLSGEMNFTVSGFGYSMKAREVLPDGLIILSFPFDTISPLIENLNDMEWEPRWFKLGREGFIRETKKLSASQRQEAA